LSSMNSIPKSQFTLPTSWSEIHPLIEGTYLPSGCY
jgi:hypothetical protein